MSFKASAPGSLMLLGEYAVLHGYPALVSAIDKRIHVTLAPREDNMLEIHSALGHLKTSLAATLELTSPFQFVIAVLKKHQKLLKKGCTITIESEFSDQVGFSSSAAVTVATLSALMAWLKISYSHVQLIRHARDIIQAVQGIGSGADVAACVLGGIVGYRMQPFFAERLAEFHDITVIYSGSKTKTVDAIAKVEQLFSAYPKLYKQVLQSIGHCAEHGIQAVKQAHWENLGHIMQIQQGLMDALGVNTALLHDMIKDLQAKPTILGAKISGSGFGDCIVGLGQVSDHDVSRWSSHGVIPIPVNIATEGVRLEKN